MAKDKVMNSGDTNMNQAGQAPPEDSDCAELDRANQQTRATLESNTDEPTVVGASGTGRGTTVASSKFGGPRGGNVQVRTAHSRQEAMDSAPDLTEGSGGKSNVQCEGHKHTHAPRKWHPKATPKGKKGHMAQKAGHSEARMIDDAFEGGAPPPGSQMTFNVDWRAKSKRGSSKMPCHSCHRMMCAAMKCEIKIFLCDKNNQKKELDPKKHCPASKKTYNKLRDDMGETPKRKR